MPASTATTIRKIFLASSAELVEHRRDFEISVCRKNRLWIRQGVFLDLNIWEDFLDALSETRLQDEYNRTIRQCDVFVMLFRSKVGRHTEEEFDAAVGQFQATRKPFVFTYFCDSPRHRAGASVSDLHGLHRFQQKLAALGHFQTRYRTSAELCAHFGGQLDKLVANGFVEFVRDRQPPAARNDFRPHAALHGSGAMAQGDRATAIAAGGVRVGGDNRGPIHTGTQVHTGMQMRSATQLHRGGQIHTGGGAYIGGSVTAHGDFIGRDCVLAPNVPAPEVNALFASLVASVAQCAPPTRCAEALQQLEQIRAEVAQGAQADDSRLAALLEALAALAPAALATLANAFASPLLAAAAGPVTRYVLGKHQGG